MYKLLLAATLLGATSSFALAADLPSRRAPPVYVPPPLPAFSWTGLYSGINAGYAFNGYTYDALTATTAAQNTAFAVGGRAVFLRQSASGFTGGGQIGYNYEIGGGVPFFGSLFGGPGAGGLVIGVEADAAYTGSSNFTPFLSLNGTGNLSTYQSKLDFLGTARGRLGYAFGDFLLYGTGGFAYGSVRDTDFFTGATSYFGATNGLRTGYAYGGGIEYAIPTTSFVNVFHSSAVTIKAEYLHYDLGTQTLYLIPTTATTGYINSIKTKGDLARLGINYKVDFGTPAPVVARY